MDERKKTYYRLLAEVICMAVAALLLFTLGGQVLGILMPFIIAFILAWALNPLIRRLQSRMRLTRKLFSYILVILIYAVFFGLCLWFVTLLISQVVDLAKAVPSIVAQLQGVYNQLIASLHELLGMLPEEYAPISEEVFAWMSSAWNALRSFITRVLSSLAGMTGNVALKTPGFVIFLTVLVLASCIITADFPNLRENIYSYLGKTGKQSVRLMGHSFQTAVLGFFRSQLIFALVDMAIILTAFFLIGVPYPLPIALLLAFLDFIPFFGAGTVLVPWGLICLPLGLTRMGLQLLLLYVILYVMRRIFEPRVLGGATGFSSLQMLFSMYAGMQLAGVTGLVVAPIIWIAAVNFVKTGALDGFFADVRFVAGDIRRTLQRPVPTKTTEPPAAHRGEKTRLFSRKKKE